MDACEEKEGLQGGPKEKVTCEVAKQSPHHSPGDGESIVPQSTPHWGDMTGPLCLSCFSQSPDTVALEQLWPCKRQFPEASANPQRAGGYLLTSFPMACATSPSLKGVWGGTSLYLPLGGMSAYSAIVLMAPELQRLTPLKLLLGIQEWGVAYLPAPSD